MNTIAALLALMPWVAAALVVLALLIIGLAIWILLPRQDDREADIERQIATLRHGADHAVKTRPRVRAHSTRVDQPCGGGVCRHRPNCADLYCPGRLAANLSGTEARHGAHR